jgi:hypothetical protein
MGGGHRRKLRSFRLERLNLGFNAGAVRANNAIVNRSADGSGGILVTNQSPGAVPFILDINGYFQ